MRKIFVTLLVGLSLLSTQIGYAQGKTSSRIVPIRVSVPVRPTGQRDVLNLTTPKMDVVRIGVIGLGMRGSTIIDVISHVPGVKIVALCDLRPDSVEGAQKRLENVGLPRAAAYSGDENAWKKLCNRNDIDLVYVITDWKHHTPIALYAMEHGKNVAIEVPAATSMKEIWELINTSERTRKHCMMLENCVYDFFEATTLNMAQHGLFGEILHTEGSYMHNLDEIWGLYWNNWRMDFNRTHRGDLYPTHGIGPDCQLLNIHRGDRMTYLVSMDTKAVNGPAYIKRTTGETVKDFQAGDETSTLIHTANGKTMLIEHDVLTPRPYSRMYQVVGTDGYASKYPVKQFCFRQGLLKSKTSVNYQNLELYESIPDSVRDLLLKRYEPDFMKQLEATAKKVGGHGGMDYILNYRLIYCLINGLPLDMDVYDLAEWCCISELSGISIKNNSAPVAIPDFTRGAWNKVKGFKYAFIK
jgi:predicted dehydrogenase